MRRVGQAPKANTLETPSTNDWLYTVGERLNVYSGISDPAVSEVPENQWIVYRNTTIPEVRIWTNIAGVLLKSAAFT
jgi:hypothetical protein